MCLRHHGCHGRHGRHHGRHGHSKIYILNIMEIKYLADMVKWQSENKVTTQRAATHVLSYELILNTNTHTALVYFLQTLHETFSINAATIVGNADSVAFEESCCRRQVITSISQNVVLLFQRCMCF